MPAYISASDVTNLSPSAAGGTTDRTAQVDEVIASLMRRIDRRTGQFFATGYTGTYEVGENDFVSYGTELAVPRMFSLDSIERHVGGGSWETVDSDRYSEALIYPQRWSGIDTIYFDRGWSGDRLRVRGDIGWGHGTGDDGFTGDEVPPEIVLEAKKQARYDWARLPIGGGSGAAIQGGDLTVEVDGWLYLMSANMTFKSFVDRRVLL